MSERAWLTAGRRAEIEAMLSEYRKGYFYNINYKAPAIIDELLAEIDRLAVVERERDAALHKIELVLAGIDGEMSADAMRYVVTRDLRGLLNTTRDSTEAGR